MAVSSRSGIIILFATITVCTLILFPILQTVVERDPQLSAYDDDWNDISQFRESLENEPDISVDIWAELETIVLPNSDSAVVTLVLKEELDSVIETNHIVERSGESFRRFI